MFGKPQECNYFIAKAKMANVKKSHLECRIYIKLDKLVKPHNAFTNACIQCLLSNFHCKFCAPERKKRCV